MSYQFISDFCPYCKAEHTWKLYFSLLDEETIDLLTTCWSCSKRWGKRVHVSL